MGPSGAKDSELSTALAGRPGSERAQSRPPGNLARSHSRFRAANKILALPMGSAPLDSEEGRRFLRQRLRLFAGLMCLVGAFALIANVTLHAAMRMRIDWRTLRTEGIDWQFMGIVTSLAIWFVLRKHWSNIVGLFIIDGLGSTLTLYAYSMMTWSGAAHAAERAGWIMMLITMCVVTTRSIIVPSTPGHTLAVTGFGCIPVLALTYFSALNYPSNMQMAPAIVTSYMSIWVVICLAITTLASQVIYGLQTQVAQAQRLGQYVLDELIGEGGMGVVYKAQHALLRRPTAIKLLLAGSSGPELLQRFEREVQLTAMLTHPNTVNVYDYGHTADGTFYYAMEYLDGINLEQLVEAFGPQDPERVVHILGQVAGSLSEAHAVGLVHRDIKPANVILCNRRALPDVVKVVDFGLVKDSRQRGHGEPSLTSVNAIIGTPLYLPPEGVLAPNKVDARSDLYSLGAVGYYLLTGQPVFTGASVIDICVQHVNVAPVAPSLRSGRNIPEPLEAFILRCLAKQPEQRPQSAEQFLDELSSTRVSPWQRDAATKWWQEHESAVIRLKRARGLAPSTETRDTLIVDFNAREGRGHLRQ